MPGETSMTTRPSQFGALGLGKQARRFFVEGLSVL